MIYEYIPETVSNQSFLYVPIIASLTDRRQSLSRAVGRTMIGAVAGCMKLSDVPDGSSLDRNFYTERGTHTSLNVNSTTNLHCGDAVVEGVTFDGFEAGAVDHFDDLLFGHFYFAAGLDGVALGQLAAVGDGAVEVVGAKAGAITSLGGQNLDVIAAGHRWRNL
jgi:hypothetical protein